MDKRQCSEYIDLWESTLPYAYSTPKRCMLSEGHVEGEHLTKDSNGQLFWFGAP